MSTTKVKRGSGEAEEVLSSLNAGAKFLGRSRQWTAAHLDEIPHKKLGRRVMFSKNALLRWLEGEQVA